MFLIGQRVDGGNVRVPGELFDLALCESTKHDALDHSAQHPRGIFKKLTTPKLKLTRSQEKRLAAQLANAYLERNSRARGRFGKDHRPDLAGQRLHGMPPALPFHQNRIGQDSFHARPREFFDAQQMFHRDANPATTDWTICNPSSASLRRKLSGGRKRRICAPAGIVSNPAWCSRLATRTA